ncbi:protease inhibitor Inh/omp19 family protein [Aquamicrobium sp. LC103]|uniref:protease inhibitor Inh/omp19 family protein n=1 Tax=Aquamicrobium sp. LC103 TaxID=1120658 RepID=UPI00063EA9FF|nr:protease inhibitor Inh/omp19 family protein [Aquamicrobium sp. LC103]TKT82826.1 hypothetical protein XW59_002350 [Aquamicrobium sp. LC103]
MGLSKSGVLAATFISIVLAGCQSDRFSQVDTRQPAPAPLSPAPAGSVTASQLPPPAQPGTMNPSQFPAAPGAESTPQDTQQMAALEQSAPDVTAGGVAGVWNASVAGQSCRIATPQTKFGQGFRAGPLRCPAPLDGVKSWNVSGKQLSLYDESGNSLAQLYSSGGERFEGQTSGGQSISLTR